MVIRQGMASLSELTKFPEHQRDDLWEKSFLASLPHSRLKLIHPSAQTGPDNWPYLFTEVSESGEPAHALLSWLSQRGIGLAINAQKNPPDFVLSYGMIWNFQQRSRFIEESEVKAPSKIELREGTKILAGPPSDDYLPPYVRAILKQFFLDQGVLVPKIIVLTEDKKNFDLCFSIESLGSPAEAEHMGVLEALSWFFPSHYSLALLPESAVPGFVNL